MASQWKSLYLLSCCDNPAGSSSIRRDHWMCMTILTAILFTGVMDKIRSVKIQVKVEPERKKILYTLNKLFLLYLSPCFCFFHSLLLCFFCFTGVSSRYRQNQAWFTVIWLCILTRSNNKKKKLGLIAMNCELSVFTTLYWFSCQQVETWEVSVVSSSFLFLLPTNPPLSCIPIW